MTLLDELLDREKRLSSGDLGFYRQACRPDALFVMPGMVASLDEAISGLEQTDPWDHFDLTDAQVRDLGDGAAAIAYRFVGDRGGQAYAADMISTYARSSQGWQLVTHQQTPA